MVSKAGHAKKIIITLFFLPVIAHAFAVMVNQTITVGEARNLPHDSWVRVSGNITNALPGGKNYTFRDSTGEIVVEIDSKIWRGLSVGASDRVEILGEIKINRGIVSIKVRAIIGEGRTSTRQGQAVTISRPITVNETRNLPHDSWVIVTGNIISSLGRNNYMFRDSTGDIIIDIGSKEWRGLSVGVNDRVEIYGEVKINRGIASIKVRAIRKV